MATISFTKIKGRASSLSYTVDHCLTKYSTYKYHDPESNPSIIK